MHLSCVAREPGSLGQADWLGGLQAGEEQDSSLKKPRDGFQRGSEGLSRKGRDVHEDGRRPLPEVPWSSSVHILRTSGAPSVLPPLQKAEVVPEGPPAHLSHLPRAVVPGGLVHFCTLHAHSPALKRSSQHSFLSTQLQPLWPQSNKIK